MIEPLFVQNNVEANPGCLIDEPTAEFVLTVPARNIVHTAPLGQPISAGPINSVSSVGMATVVTTKVPPNGMVLIVRLVAAAQLPPVRLLTPRNEDTPPTSEGTMGYKLQGNAKAVAIGAAINASHTPNPVNFLMFIPSLSWLMP